MAKSWLFGKVLALGRGTELKEDARMYIKPKYSCMYSTYNPTGFVFAHLYVY
jgi:hypothetical protein